MNTSKVGPTNGSLFIGSFRSTPVDPETHVLDADTGLASSTGVATVRGNVEIIYIQGGPKKSGISKIIVFIQYLCDFFSYYRALLGPTGPYWALLGLTGPYWALLSLI